MTEHSEQFEAWAEKAGYATQRTSSGYVSPLTQCAWLAWKASSIAMQEEIAALETSLAERWENLNVQDGVIDGLREEIAALRAERDRLQNKEFAGTLADLMGVKVDDLVERIAALEKACAASAKCYPIVGIDVTSRTSYFDRKRMAEALRSAGYLGGGE